MNLCEHREHREQREPSLGVPRALERAIALMHEAVMVINATPMTSRPRVAYVNDAFTRMTGYSHGEVVGSLPETLWAQPGDRVMIEHATRELRAGRSFEGRMIGYRKDGTPFLLEGYVEPIGRGGSQFLMVMRDVTDQAPRDAAMRHIAAALDHVDEAIVVLSKGRQVHYLNRAANELFGGEGEVQLPLPKNAWKQLDQGLAWTGQVEVSGADGERRLRIDVQPVQGFDGEPSLLVIVHDVTHVERLQSIADSVNLSDNLGHFLSGIRHELGNPINSIKTALTVLRSNLDTFSPEKINDYVDRVLGEVGRVEYLLCSLRSFSLHESVTLDRVELSTIIREIVALVQPSVLRSGVLLEVDPAPEVAIIADVRAVYQILLNLVSNAIEALPAPGDCCIRLETTAGPDYVDISISDNGPGMSHDDMALAMRPFFTTKRKGTGLGLVIAQRLAANQGGRLRLYSERGKGTRAVVSLARAPARDDRS